MKNNSERKVGLSLAAALLMGGMAFTAGNANAGFFDQLKQSLGAVNSELNRAQAGVADAHAKMDEARTNIDETKANLKAQSDQSRANLEETKANGDETVNNLKGLASFNND